MAERSSVSVRGQRGRGMGGHSKPNDGPTVEWYTPPGLFDALGLSFDLDPCQPPGGLPWIPAARHFSKLDDGLSQPWEGKVWMNPPYGRSTATWMERFARHGNGVALVFARTETEWFQRVARSLDALCFIRGRLTFVTEDRQPGPFNSGAPSLLAACGDECAEALERCGLGLTVRCRRETSPSAQMLWEAA